MFKSKMVKIERDVLDSLYEKFIQQENDIEKLKTMLIKQIKENSSIKKELDDINSLDINTSSIQQRDAAKRELELVKAENKTLLVENKYLKISNTSNEILLKESLKTLKQYSERSLSLDDYTYKINKLI